MERYPCAYPSLCQAGIVTENCSRPFKKRGILLAILAVQHIRRMRGGAQSHLMLGEDGFAYVVKFQNNPQHTRVLANEFLVSSLARIVGLSTPQAEIMDVPHRLIKNTPELRIDFGRTLVPCKAGLQFGSRFVAQTASDPIVDYLPEKQLAEVQNLKEFAGILALDKWTANCDSRQALFVRQRSESRYRAVFIDFGHCFDAGNWRFYDSPIRGGYYDNRVYRQIAGWEAFEPWLTRIETISSQTIMDIVHQLPKEWYGNSRSEMKMLVERLLMRRSRIREWIESFALSDRRPFPRWDLAGQKAYRRSASRLACA